MNKTELIAAMSEVSGLTKKDCEVAASRPKSVPPVLAAIPVPASP